MAKGLNQVNLIGNLGNDVDLKYTQGGMAIATLSLATTRSRKDKDGNYQDETSWHRVKLFGKTAEVASEYLKKGSSVYIGGRLEYGNYEKDGVKHYTTDIIGEDMQMLGGKSEAAPGSSRQTAQRREPAPASAPAVDDDFSDSIPF